MSLDVNATNHSQNLLHCYDCKKLFYTNVGLRRHEKASKNHQKLCTDSTHEHQLVHEEFSTMAEAREWFFAKEFDKLLTTSTSREDYVRYQCRHTRARKEAHPAKTNYYARIPSFSCPAKLTIHKAKICQCPENNAAKTCHKQGVVFRVLGCAAHSHEVEMQHNLLGRKSKETLIELLDAGIPKKTILKRYCSSVRDKSTNQKLITEMDLRNLQRHRYRVTKKIDQSKANQLTAFGVDPNDDHSSTTPSEESAEAEVSEDVHADKDSPMRKNNGMELNAQKKKVVEILLEWKDSVEKSTSLKEVTRILEHLEKFSNEASSSIIMNKTETLPSPNRKRKRLS